MPSRGSAADDSSAAGGGAPSSQRQRVTRQDVVALGQKNEPYRFIPLAEQVLAQVPTDDGVRFLAAVSCARLGLKTAATEHLDRLTPIGLADPGALALRQAVGQLPEDRVLRDELAATLEANLAAMPAAEREKNGFDVPAMVEAWRERDERLGRQWFRTRGGEESGQLVRRRRRDDGGWVWEKFADFRSAAAATKLPHEQEGEQSAEGPLTIEGVDPPWLLVRMAESAPRRVSGLGYHARLNVVQADASEFMDGLAQADLRRVLGEARTRVFAGERGGVNAAARFAADLMARLGERLHGPGIVAPGVSTRATPTIDDSIRAALETQQREHKRLLAEVEAIYAPRDAAWWATRFCTGVGGAPVPRTDKALRVLIPTCLYSTFIRHAAADLAEVFGAMGCEARVLIEPEACAHLSSIAYLRAFAEFTPDLVVTINYPRATMRGMIPGWDEHGRPGGRRGVPLVCWVQDSMPHLFDPAVGRSQGPLDFLVGNLPAELFLRFGYPRERALDAPMVASTRKFALSEAEIARRGNERSCELLYVSHQSQPAKGLYEERRKDAAGNAAVVRAMDELFDEVSRLVERESAELKSRTRDDEGLGLMGGLREATRGAVARHLGEQASNDERCVSQLASGFSVPIADRMLRHQTLGWAAELCRARGWRLHLHGNGWESHPELAAFAKGALPHDEALRDAYASAAATLQVSLHSAVHQRVFECALAGGLPICRLNDDDLSALRHWAAAEAYKHGEPAACKAERIRYRDGRVFEWLGFPADDREEGRRVNALLRGLGVPERGWWWLNSAHAPALRGGGTAARAAEGLAELPCEANLLWLMGDAAAACFVDRAGFERVLSRAVEDAPARAASAAHLRGRVHERLTHASLARRMLEMLRTGLEHPSESAR